MVQSCKIYTFLAHIIEAFFLNRIILYRKLYHKKIASRIKKMISGLKFHIELNAVIQDVKKVFSNFKFNN